MASKYIIVLLLLCITGFVTLGVKRLLLMRAGFNPQRKPINWVMVGLLVVLTAFLLSCSNKSPETPVEAAGTDTERNQEPVVVTKSDEKTTDIHKEVDGKGNVTATVTISTKNDNNEIVTEEKIIKGTRAEVDAQIKSLNNKE